MDLGLSGKVAWVTGASSGIGRAIAEALAREGATVAISARRENLLKEVAGGIGENAHAYPLDLTDERTIHDAAERIHADLGPINILVANAGGPPSGTFESTDDDALRAGVELTLWSSWHLAKEAASHMQASGKGGVVIFITSWSTKEIIQGLLISNMLRAAVTGLAKTMSKELGPKGIRVLCVAPGRIDTERIEELESLTAERTGRSIDEMRAVSVAGVPLGRYGRPDEIGDVIAFLASERASYVSGITVVVDGGQLNMVGA